MRVLANAVRLVR